MTEFEQQVAEALRTIRSPVGGGVESFAMAPMDDESINRLAPRVAAAIRAADTEALLPDDGAEAISTDERDHREHILRALRGE